MICDIPQIKAYVKNEFIMDDDGHTECYIYSVTGIKNRPLLWNIHTIHGALYSRLPLEALSLTKQIAFPLFQEELDQWGVIGDRFQVIEHSYLKGYEPLLIKHKNIAARYLFSLDWFQGGFSEDPEQSKTLHLLALKNGQLGMFPNNDLRWVDKHFTEDGPMPKYKRNSTYFTPNG